MRYPIYESFERHKLVYAVPLGHMQQVRISLH
jgi:hypothetical protein